jgi:putative colanic acid biosynthesis glycosyltransferase
VSVVAPRQRIAIITVVKQHPEGLARTAASLCRVRGVDLAWFVADGGAAPNPPPAPNPTIPVWYDQRPDTGPYDGMNRALAAVEAQGTADAVLFLNAGDVLETPDGLAHLLATQALAYGDGCEVGPDGQLWHWPARTPRALAFGMPAHHQAMLYPLACVAGLRFDLRYPIGADYAFTLQAARRAAVHYVPVTICGFEGGGLSHQNACQGRIDQYAIRRVLLGWPAPLAWIWRVVQAARWQVRQRLWPLFRWLRQLAPVKPAGSQRRS